MQALFGSHAPTVTMVLEHSPLPRPAGSDVSLCGECGTLLEREIHGAGTIITCSTCGTPNMRREAKRSA